jgi:hypothetical protein
MTKRTAPEEVHSDAPIVKKPRRSRKSVGYFCKDCNANWSSDHNEICTANILVDDVQDIAEDVNVVNEVAEATDNIVKNIYSDADIEGEAELEKSLKPFPIRNFYVENFLTKERRLIPQSKENFNIDGIKLGREKNEDTYISRIHAHLFIKNNKAYVLPVSLNNTFLLFNKNGRVQKRKLAKHKETLLEEGQEINLSSSPDDTSYIWRFYSEEI